MTPRIHIIPILRDNYTYLIEGENKACLIVDPGQTRPVQVAIEQQGLKPALILNTHHHADHVAGNAELRAQYNVKTVGPKSEMTLIPRLDRGVSEGDTVEEASVRLQVWATPGHTNGHISFYCEEAKSLFCGDTMFSMGCGRLVEGTAHDMWSSLQRIKSLPIDTNIYCGHEYTESNGAFALSCFPNNPDITARMNDVKKLRMNGLPSLPVTLETELKTNPFLMCGTLEEFIDLRQRKDVF